MGQCPPLPPNYYPAPPGLPGGVSLSAFTPPVISLGLCCNLRVPPWGTFPVPLPPFPVAVGAAVVSLLASIESGIQATLDAIPVPCPIQ